MIIKFTHPQLSQLLNQKELEMGKDKKINWSLYNKSLVNRGQITFWFSADIVKSWYAKRSLEQGCQQIYSDRAIETLNTLRLIQFNDIGSRQLKGTINLSHNALALRWLATVRSEAWHSHYGARFRKTNL